MECLNVGGEVQCSSMHGDLIAFGNHKNVIVYRASDLTDGSDIARMRFDSNVFSVAFSPCGTNVVAGLQSGIIEMHSLLTTWFRRVFRGHDNRMQSMLFNMCGSRGDTYPLIISGSWDGTVNIWDSAAGACLATADFGSSVCGLALLPGGREVLVGTSGGMLIVIGMDGIKKCEVRIEGGAVATALACAGDAVVVGLGDGHLQLREATRLEHIVWSSQVHQSWIKSVCVSPNGAEIVTASYDMTSVIVSFTTGDILRVLRGHTNSVNTVVFTPDGSKVITGSDDNTIRTWDLFPKSRKCLSSFLHPIDPEKLLHHSEHVVTALYGRLKRNLFVNVENE